MKQSTTMSRDKLFLDVLVEARRYIGDLARQLSLYLNNYHTNVKYAHGFNEKYRDNIFDLLEDNFHKPILNENYDLQGVIINYRHKHKLKNVNHFIILIPCYAKKKGFFRDKWYYTAIYFMEIGRHIINENIWPEECSFPELASVRKNSTMMLIVDEQSRQDTSLASSVA